VRGWKIGVTNDAARRLLGIPDPVAGRLYAPFCQTSPGSFSADEFSMRALEPEIAFTIAEDVTAPCREVPFASAHPALEIPDTRWKDWTRIGPPGFVADNSAAGRFVLGPARDWPGRVPAKLVINGKVAAEGGSELVMGDPLNALVWLANHLLERGLHLKRGDIVTTGTCTPIKQAQRGDHVVAEFDGFGSAEVRFT
jgi:2-keto-4-pentenoate hydratase